MKVKGFFMAAVLLALALGVEGGLLALARWQWHRYQQRQAGQAEFAARPAVALAGVFDNAATAALTNQPHPLNPEGQVGWRILTPLRTPQGVVVVDRGWAAPALAGNGPDFSGFATSATAVAGVWQPYPRRQGWLRGPDTTTHPRLLAFLNPALVTPATQPGAYLIARTPTAGVVAVPPPLPAPLRHLSYALQWLGLALAFPVMCGALAVSRSRRGRRRP